MRAALDPGAGGEPRPSQLRKLIRNGRPQPTTGPPSWTLQRPARRGRRKPPRDTGPVDLLASLVQASSSTPSAMPYVCRRLRYRGNQSPATAGGAASYSREEAPRRAHRVFMLVTAVVSLLFGMRGHGRANPRPRGVKGTDTGQACQVNVRPAYNINISLPGATPTRSRWKITSLNARRVPQRGRIVLRNAAPTGGISPRPHTSPRYRRVVHQAWLLKV